MPGTDLRRCRTGPRRPILRAMSRPTTAPAPDARTRRFLETEAVVWLSTSSADGRPHLVPVWFWWDGEAVVIYSKPEAVKVRHLREHPVAMLALGDAEDDFDVGLIEARAELTEAPRELPAAFVAKYGARMPAGRLDPATFAATYTQAIRLVPTRFLEWHGRSEPASMPRSAHVAELRRPTLRAGLTAWLRGLRLPRLGPAAA